MRGIRPRVLLIVLTVVGGAPGNGRYSATIYARHVRLGIWRVAQVAGDSAFIWDRD